jgi:hypothetical protein
MFTVKRSSLKALSICLGLLFTAGFYYFFHYRLPWDWDAPGTGRLPQEIVRGFMAEAYEEGRGASAVQNYFSPQVADAAPEAQDRRNGDPIPHEVLSVVAQGQTIVVIHRIAASRGQPALDVIDVFETNRGRIVKRERYLTNFDQ